MRSFSAFRAKKPLHTGVRTGCHYLVSLSVCVHVCVTIAVFTDCESCTRLISTHPGSMEASERGLTRGARFVAVCLGVVAVAALMWVSWCVFGGAKFFLYFQETTSSSSYTRGSQSRLGEAAPTASQPAHRELAPTYPHQVNRLVCSTELRPGGRESMRAKIINVMKRKGKSTCTSDVSWSFRTKCKIQNMADPPVGRRDQLLSLVLDISVHPVYVFLIRTYYTHGITCEGIQYGYQQNCPQNNLL